MLPDSAGSSFKCSIAPWLSVRSSAKAIDFYKSAFGAKEVYRLEDPGGGVVVRLSVNGAEFWLSHESADHANASPDPIGRCDFRPGHRCRGDPNFSRRRGTRLASGPPRRSFQIALGNWSSTRDVSAPPGTEKNRLAVPRTTNTL